MEGVEILIMIVSDGPRALMAKILVIFGFDARPNVAPTVAETAKGLH